MAGTKALELLLERAPDRFDVTVFGAEPWAGYDRIQLSGVLAGEKSVDGIALQSADWYAEHGVTLHTGCRVDRIDVARRRVVAGERTVPFDRLLLTTGSSAVRLPLPGADLDGVLGFRGIGDVEAMLAAADAGGHAVVIGGGLLGLEAAHGLQQRGMHVTVVHLCDTLMERQLDRNAGRLLELELRRRGMDVRTSACTAEMLGDDRVAGIRLKSGETIACDLVVMAVGIRPNVELATEAGIACGRGIRVDDLLCTSAPRVYALGECAEHRGHTYGLVAPLYEMARVWADQLTGRPTFGYRGSKPSTRLKVAGIDVFSAGVLEAPGTDVVRLEDPGRGVYRRVLLDDDRVVGVVMYGDTTDSSWYAQLLREETDVAAIRDDLIFGRAFAEAVRGEAETVADVTSRPDSAEICGCNGVCKGAIVAAIRQKRLTTLDEVRAHTKASSSCGTCTPDVTALMEATLGAAFERREGEPPVCGCTGATHAEVRRVIKAEEITRMDALMERLGWRTEDGCAKCRPALNYYLLAAWPGRYRDDARSRFVNERVHANIQRDGTFSVVPRIWGGITTPDELRAIADAADKYAVRTVKITGGQRIDLLGIAKADLPAIWADLNAAGLVSGHAYAKGVRTVKTCVGSEWCRFGVQDSTTLGQRLERTLWAAWAPHKFKLAVSGCPRNCAEATIKDFGVVAVESGFELHVAGNGGMKVRATDRLCHVRTPDEVLEYAAAFLQLYREEAFYGKERTAHWVERVGIEYVRRRLVEDDVGRRALRARFEESQRFSQSDPWAAIQQNKPKDFIPLQALEVSA